MSTFWENVLTLMREKKISQVYIAKGIGKSKATINTWIKRDTVPPADYAHKIATILGVTVEALLEEDQIELDMAVMQIQKSPSTRRIVEMLIPFPESIIEKVRHGISGILTSMGYSTDGKDEKGEPGSMAG